MTLPVSMRVEDTDVAPWLAVVALAGLVGALALWVVGLPSVDFHGPLYEAGIMSPLCGGTRATYVLVNGDLAGSWSWNPVVPMLALLTALVVGRSLVGLVTNRWVNLRLSRRAALIGLGVALAVLEVNQQLQAERLMTVVPT